MNETNERSVASLGSGGEPVLWAIEHTRRGFSVLDPWCYESKARAEQGVADMGRGGVVVPLYRQPQPAPEAT
jgi:hypothetical protein